MIFDFTVDQQRETIVHNSKIIFVTDLIMRKKFFQLFDPVMRRLILRA